MVAQRSQEHPAFGVAAGAAIVETPPSQNAERLLCQLFYPFCAMPSLMASG